MAMKATFRRTPPGGVESTTAEINQEILLAELHLDT